MKNSLFLLIVVVLMMSLFVFTSCKDKTVSPAEGTETENGDEVTPSTNEYAVKGAKDSTEESRKALEEKFKALQTSYNFAVDTVAGASKEEKDAVKDFGTNYVDLLKNKIADPEYSKYEAFIQDAIKQVSEMQKQLKDLVPSIAG